MKSFLMMLSGISVISAVVWLLIPKGATGKLMKYCLGLFFIATIVNFTYKTDFSLPKTDIDNIYYSEIVQKTQVETIEATLKMFLRKEGIEVNKIEVVTDNSKSDSISINKVVLETVSNEDFIKAAQLIKSETGIEAVEEE